VRTDLGIFASLDNRQRARDSAVGCNYTSVDITLSGLKLIIELTCCSMNAVSLCAFHNHLSAHIVINGDGDGMLY